jgi:hypothetical protein
VAKVAAMIVLAWSRLSARILVPPGSRPTSAIDARRRRFVATSSAARFSY